MQNNTVTIICAGSRLTAEDGAGPMVYDYLAAQDLPPAVQLIDGGLAGLDLLRFIDQAARVILVDSIAGFNPDTEVMALTLDEVLAATSAPSFSHGDGLGYLLHALPELYPDRTPEVHVVGIQGTPEPALIRQAAETSLHLALEEL